MASRSDRSLLLFSGGEITPLLAGRTDVERISAGCRTLQNMLVDLGGAVSRRPGLEFIAETKETAELSFVSMTGTATYYGITEFGNVSDPPRKYRMLTHNYGAYGRSAAGLTTFGLFPGLATRVRYSTAGVRVDDLSFGVGSSIVDVGTAAGYTDQLTLEDVQDAPNQTSGDWVAFPPNWIREKTAKYFRDFTEASGESQALRYGLATGTNGGLNATSMGVTMAVAWETDHWKLTFAMAGDFGTGGSGGNETLTLHVKLVSGDADPGEVTTDDYLLISGDVSGGEAGTLVLPPDTSARFRIFRSGAGGWPAQQWPLQFTDSADPDTDVTDWFYFPPASDDLPWEYRETLSVEDTLADALNRASGVEIGTGATAATTALSGGIAAESHDPITWTGTIVLVSKTFTGLTTNHRYRVNVLVRTNTIGDDDFVLNTIDGGEFVATSAAFVFTYELRAPLGCQRQVLEMTAVDQGAEPTPGATYDVDTLVYWGRVLDNGGTITDASLAIADALIKQLKAEGLWTKIVYLLPFLGDDLAAALVPLRDRDKAGNPTNTNFVESDFSESTGLQGNGTNKIITLPFTAADLGTNGNGGLGFWEMDIVFGIGGNGPMGYQSSNDFRYALDLRSTRTLFWWGALAGVAEVSPQTGAINGHYYGQRSAATSRRLFRNGVEIAENTANAATNEANGGALRLMGIRHDSIGQTRFWGGRCGVAYVTDGTLSDGEIEDLHAILREFLMEPTGRIASTDA